MVDYNDGIWHSWDGDVLRPVDPKTIVNAIVDGEHVKGVLAETVPWEHVGAFCVVHESKSPRTVFVVYYKGGPVSVHSERLTTAIPSDYSLVEFAEVVKPKS